MTYEVIFTEDSLSSVGCVKKENVALCLQDTFKDIRFDLNYTDTKCCCHIGNGRNR